MAAPIARVRTRRAPRTEELSIAKTRRNSSNIDTSPFRHPTPQVSAGEKFGPYTVYEQLGEGGMAYVHRAELLGTAGFRKEVALKRMRTVTSENPDFVTSFINEGQLVGKLRHGNIAQAFELGKIGGTYYIAMEFVPGPTLAQVMAQSRRCAGAIPLPIILELLIQLCDALDHAHNLHDEGGKPLGLVHRDISPMNVIVSRAGAAKLIDFGIAKARGSSIVTQAGVIKGKHAYVAPEYTLGSALDRRVDLWGLGVVAHELITGRRLFLGDTEAETIRNVRSMAVPPPSRIANGISKELDDIVLTALERDPDKRWQSAAALRTALTEEVRRGNFKVSGAQIRDWVEWAFRQPTRDDAPIGDVMSDLEPSISIQMHELEPVPPPIPQRPAPPAPPLLADASGEINPDDMPTLDAKVTPVRPATPADKIVVDLHSRTTPRFVTPRVETVPSLGFAPRVRIATGTVPPDDEPRLTPTLPRQRLGSIPEPIVPEVSVPLIRPAQFPRIATPPEPRAATPPEERVTPPLRRRPFTPIPDAPVRSSQTATLDLSDAARAPTAEAPRALSPWADALGRARAGLPREITRATPHRVTPHPLPVHAVMPRRGSALAIPMPVVPSGTAKVKPLRLYNDRPLGVPAPAPRKPRWNPPTRWAREPKPSQLPQLFVLLLLGGFAVMAIQLGWIDLDRWQSIIDSI